MAQNPLTATAYRLGNENYSAAIALLIATVSFLTTIVSAILVRGFLRLIPIL